MTIHGWGIRYLKGVNAPVVNTLLLRKRGFGMSWNEIIPSAEAIAGFIRTATLYIGLIAIGALACAYYTRNDFLRGFNYALAHGQVERVVVK